MIISLIVLFLITSVLSVLPLPILLKKYIYFFLGFVLIFLAATRGEGVDRDYLSYIELYNTSQFGINVEIAFVLISKFVQFFLFDNVFFLFLIYSILGVTTKFYSIYKLSSLWFLSILIYISNFYALHDLTQIRAGVASGILLMCIKPIYERNIKSFLILVSFAFCFHYSAIAIIPLYFVSSKIKNLRIYLLLIPLMYLLYFAGVRLTTLLSMLPIPSIQQKIMAYKLIMENGEMSEINIFNIFFLLKIIMCFFLMWKSTNISQQNKYFIILLKIYIIGLSSFIVFSDFPTLAFRISELYQIVEIILVPMIIYAFTEKRLASLIPILYASVLLGLILFYNKIIT